MPASQEDWRRVGAQLAERRAQIDDRYAVRAVFADAAGLNYRMVYDVENGKRATFTLKTIRALERGYQLVPGSLDRALAAPRSLEPLPAPAAPQVVPAPAGDDDDEATAERDYGRLLLATDDPLEARLLRIIGRSVDADESPYPWRHKLELATEFLSRTAGARGRPEADAG